MPHTERVSALLGDESCRVHVIVIVAVPVFGSPEQVAILRPPCIQVSKVASVKAYEPVIRPDANFPEYGAAVRLLVFRERKNGGQGVGGVRIGDGSRP